MENLKVTLVTESKLVDDSVIYMGSLSIENASNFQINFENDTTTITFDDPTHYCVINDPIMVSGKWDIVEKTESCLSMKCDIARTIVLEKELVN